MPEIVYAVVPARRFSRPVARLQELATECTGRSSSSFVAVVAVSIVIFIRVVLAAHQVPRWQEDLARILPLLD
jgi:hypothetical protein